MSDASKPESDGEKPTYVSMQSYIFGNEALVDFVEVVGQNAFDGAQIAIVTDGNFMAGFENPEVAMRVGRELIRIGMAMKGVEESGDCDCDAPTDIDDGDEPGIEQPRSGD